MLLQNGILLAQIPCRFTGGVFCDSPSLFGRSDRLSRFTGETYSASASTPDGHLPPSAWILPIKGGQLSSFNDATFGVTGNSPVVAAGFNVTASATFSFSTDPIVLQSIVSSLGPATFGFTTNAPDISAAVFLTASDSFGFSTNTPDINLVGNFDAIDSFGFSGNTPAIQRIVWLEADDVEAAAVLTADDVAQAVWLNTLSNGEQAQAVLIKAMKNAKLAVALSAAG